MANSEKKSFRVFVRTWWKHNPEWPNGLEPDSNAPCKTIAYAADEREARALCAEWNYANKPGKLSRKAEYTRMGE